MPITNERFAAAVAERYTIDRELGQGGMATVYLAHDRKHDRTVAIKVLRPELAAAIGAERFLAEIRTTASLQHPHILPLFDSGIADSFLFYVMPFVDGVTLRDRIAREQQLPVADAVGIATQVAAALDYAHRQGVVHRDIKPENILLHDGSALVADFGIALAASKTGGARMTETGMSLGTPQYMSPEQAMGEREITARSDVYALGCITYEMLAGEPPFTGPTAQAIVAKMMTDLPKSLTSQRRSVPRNVDAAVSTALEKLPGDRFASAAEFASALADGRYARPGGAAASIGTSAAFWKATTIVSLAAVAVLAVLVSRAGRNDTPGADRSPWSVILAFADSAAPISDVDLSRDGSTIVYRAYGEHGMQLWLRNAASLASVVVPGTNVGPAFPKLSPDGRRILFWGNDSLFVVPRDGSRPPVAVIPYPSHYGIGWADNDHVLSGGDSGVVSVAVAGGATRIITAVDTARGESYHTSPDALPDGKGVIFTVRMRGESKLDQSQIAVSDPATGRHTILMPGVNARYAAPDHLIVIDANGSMVAVPFDLAHRRLSGAPVTLISGLDRNTGFSVAATGRLVYRGAPGDPLGLVRVARDGSTLHVVDSTWDIGSVAVSPDGRRIVTVVGSKSARTTAVRDLASGSTTPIAPPGVAAFDAEFTPDGRTVVFKSFNDHGAEVFRASADGPAHTERLADVPASDIMPSSDSRSVFYTKSPSKNAKPAIFMRALDPHSRAERLVAAAPGNLSNPAPSPDGRWLAYISDESGKSQLYVRSLDSSRTQQWQVSRAGARGVRWSRDGRELYYTTDFETGGDSMMVAQVAPGNEFEMTGPRALFSTARFLTGAVWEWNVLPKNGEFLMMQRVRNADSRNRIVMIEQWQSLLGAKDPPRE